MGDREPVFVCVHESLSVSNCGLILIFLALQTTVVHTAAFFGNGDNGEYMLSKKFINNTSRGPKASSPAMQSAPRPSETHLRFLLEKVRTSSLLRTESLHQLSPSISPSDPGVSVPDERKVKLEKGAHFKRRSYKLSGEKM